MRYCKHTHTHNSWHTSSEPVKYPAACPLTITVVERSPEDSRLFSLPPRLSCSHSLLAFPLSIPVHESRGLPGLLLRSEAFGFHWREREGRRRGRKGEREREGRREWERERERESEREREGRRERERTQRVQCT